LSFAGILRVSLGYAADDVEYHIGVVSLAVYFDTAFKPGDGRDDSRLGTLAIARQLMRSSMSGISGRSRIEGANGRPPNAGNGLTGVQLFMVAAGLELCTKNRE
jgi:hypothetical protein